MADCLFCSLVGNPKPGFLIHQDADVAAFRDLHPQAPTHVLIVPKKHFPDLAAMEKEPALIGKLYAAAVKIARDEKIGDGFRVVVNTGAKGGQTVFHTHLHLLGGKQMGGNLIGD